MKIFKTNLEGLEVFESKNFFDNRGYFRELFLKKKTKKKYNIYSCFKIQKKCA